ncbi:MAG: 7-carboxy-7-deazaguanine synthase [Chlamydiae bacterium]|nr:7-carboxy-7-deazaguanine synthase [Chlamydiota bacterium]
MPWEEIIHFLKNRRNLLDGIVFSGGEPLSQPHLKEAIIEVKELGFKIGLHTSGAVPNRLEKVIPWLDWVGMDIKAPFDQYERITLVKNSGKNAQLAAHLLLESGVPCEFRTTVHSQLLSKNDILTLANTLQEMGAKNFALQNFRSQGCEDQELNTSARPFHFDAALSEELEGKFDSFICR